MTHTLDIKVHWSENALVNRSFTEGKYYPVDRVNMVLRRATNQVIQQDGGYDKTKYTLRVTDESGKQNEYTGRIDIGSDTAGSYHVVQGEIKSYCAYMLKEDTPDYLKPESDAEREEIALWIEIMDESMQKFQTSRSP